MPRFQPRYVSITLAAACTTLASHATLALSCALSGGGEELKEPLDKVIVVDRSPAGSEIWRSPVKHAAVRCDFDQARAGWSERIYFYPNPRNATPVPNVEFGVLYKNVAYWSNARIDTGYKTMPDSRAPNGFGVSFNLDFQVIMRKKSAGAIGQATMSSFDVWQMDGEGGLNDRRYALNYQSPVSATSLAPVARRRSKRRRAPCISKPCPSAIWNGAKPQWRRFRWILPALPATRRFQWTWCSRRHSATPPIPI